MFLAVFKNLLKILNKKWFMIITMTLIISLAHASYNFLVNYNKITMIMSLNYPGAEKGLNPDGTRFNIFEIKSEQVLDKALANFSQSGLTVDKLRNRIDVYERTSSVTAENIKNTRTSGYDFKYVPNEYLVSYSQKNKLDKNHTYEMIKAIAMAYEEVFKSKHADNNEILKFDQKCFKDYDNYEYIEIADLLLDKVMAIEAYISKRNSESTTYFSKEAEETYANILIMLQNFRKIDIEKFKAFIVSSTIAKDKDAYINKLRYNVETLSFERRKEINKVDFIKDAMQKYDPNITGVAFIPSFDKENEFYMNRTKTGIDYLAADAYSAGIAAEKLTKEIARNNYLIDVFSGNGLNENDTNRLKTVADNMLTELMKKIFEIQSIAVKVDNEYISYRTRDYLKFNIPNKSFVRSFGLVPSAIFTFWVFIITCSLIISKEHLFRRSQA
jgi:hypothetical protein